MPQALTVITKIKGGDEAERLRLLLDSLGKNLDNNEFIKFKDMPTVHFAAWLILPKLKNCPARLVLETNYDKTAEEHLDDLIEHGGTALDKIYGFCEDYPGGAQANNAAAVRKYLLSRKVEYSAYYVAFPGRPLEDIRNAIAVYEEAKRVLEGLRRDSRSDSEICVLLIDHFLRLQGPARPRAFPVTQRGLRRRFVFNLVAGLPLCVALIVTLLVLGTVALPFEFMERGGPARGDETNHKPEYEPMAMPLQSHLCTFTTVRRNWLRRFFLRLVLLTTRIVAAKIFILGKLSHVPTVHFGRWIQIDQGKRLVFLSNFDGSWSSYLDEFAFPPWGVNAIWGNTYGYPPTRFLLEKGARDLDAFQEQNAQHFVRAPVSYSAYRSGNRAYTVANIKRYLEYRDQLVAVLKKPGTGASRWLRQ
jgi:hypothetical protein